MKHNVTLLKLGGAVITNKEIPESVRTDVLDRLIKEISQAQKQSSKLLVLGNGAGSFAHVPATRYKTMDGFVGSDSRIGMAITQDSAARLNRIVVAACLREDIPAVSVAPSNSLITEAKVAKTWFSEVFEEYLRNQLTPVTYGDVLVDRKQGCTIWSTDKVFSFFARQFQQRDWNVEQIIHVTEATGVWQKEGSDWKMDGTEKVIYPQITPSMREEVKLSMTDTKGFDVTGGMWHKIEEALSLTELGITTRIISGLEPGNVYKVLTGDTSIGTTIHGD